MKKSIFLKVLTGFFITAVSVSAVTLFLSFEVIYDFYIEKTENSLIIRNRPVYDKASDLLSAGRIKELRTTVSHYGNLNMNRITVIDSEGNVRADSAVEPSTMYNHKSRPEIAAAFSGMTGRSVRYSSSMFKEMIYVAVPLTKKGDIIGVIRYSLPSDGQIFSMLKVRLFFVLIAISILSLIVAYIFSVRVSRPLFELRNAAEKIASGDFSTRVRRMEEAELRGLAEGFNDMAEKLYLYFESTKRHKDELEGIISSMSEGLLLLDSDGRVVIVNASAKVILGSISPEGRFYWEILRSESLRDILKRGMSHAQTEIEISGRIFLASATRVISGHVLIFHDITDMKHVEQIKKDLVVNISHELRTPLTAIKGFVETLIDDAKDEQRNYLDIVKRHTDRLINIVEDLLVLSELEDRPVSLSFEKVDMGNVINSVAALFMPKANQKGLSFKAEIEPVIISGDSFRLEQLLTNLIDNAIKYTEKGEIFVGVRVDSGNAVITVRDTGIGIPREHLLRIFERFYVVDKSRSRSVGGTGLGLSIAKHITTLHKGRIMAESIPLTGTTFTVTLPIE
jgi:two-component system, OmpR family, phosphate regulon sensor histidine kinase PhoR